MHVQYVVCVQFIDTVMSAYVVSPIAQFTLELIYQSVGVWVTQCDNACSLNPVSHSTSLVPRPKTHKHPSHVCMMGLGMGLSLHVHTL